MATINLKEKLKRLSHKEFVFTNLTPSKDKDGNSIAILQLETPIPLVRGTQEVEWNGRMRPITAQDVNEIKVHEEDMNDDFKFDDVSDGGTYSGSELILDVSKGGVVWLRKVSLATSANNFRGVQRNARMAKLFGEALVTPDALKPAVVDGTKPAVKPVDVPVGAKPAK